MAIRIDCPRCKNPLAVPVKKAGNYVSCPRCQGRFWVPRDAASDAPSEESVTVPPGMAGAPLATPPTLNSSVEPQADHATGATAGLPSSATGATAGLPSSATGATAGLSSSATGAMNKPGINSPRVAGPAISPSPALIPTRKTARLISAEAAPSPLALAADGRLPELQLHEGEKKDRAETKPTTVPPAILFGVLALSIVMSIGIALIDTESGPAGHSDRRQAALEIIEQNYFGNPEYRPLERYQLLLREARQARSRNDRKTERKCYLEVLDLLRTESRDATGRDRRPRPTDPGITGSRQRDWELQEQINVLLGGG